MIITLASSVFAKFCFSDVYSNKEDVTPAEFQGSCSVNYYGVLPNPKTVGFINVLVHGHLTNLFRCSVKKSQAQKIAFQEAMQIFTKKSCCRSISREAFHSAVYCTMRAMVNNRCIEIPKRAKIVIDHIYNAAYDCQASVDELINFTSIALHNMYIFFKFTEVNPRNVCIGEVCRGLLQFKTLPNYQKLSSVSKINYITKPYLLDEFSACSILDEFKAYCKYYSECLCASKTSKFIVSIHLLSPHESPYVTEEAAIAIRRGTYKPTNECERRVLHRFTIYNILSRCIFESGDIAVRIIEN